MKQTILTALFAIASTVTLFGSTGYLIDLSNQAHTGTPQVATYDIAAR